MFILSVILYASAAASALIFFKSHKASNIITNLICMAASALGAAASLGYIFSAADRTVVWQLRTAVPFITADLTVDRLSAFFLLALSVLVFCVSLYSIGYVSHYYNKRNVGLFNFLYAAFILSMVLVITAGDAVFFLIAWEAMAVMSYFLVTFESEKAETRRAGVLYVIMTHIGTAFLTAAFMMMFAYTHSFALYGAGGGAAIPGAVKNLMFVFMLIGFGTKAGLVPVHIWLPHAHPAAPGNISALMSGVMIHTAVYGVLRFVLDYLGVNDVWWGAAILAAGVVSAVIGVAYAYIDTNMKRLLAFSSIENIGIIFIGTGIAFIAFASGAKYTGTLALTASLLHMLNHTLFKGGLFLGAGSVHFATHTKNMEEMGGLIKKMPVTAVMMLGGSLAISALIPFNGFVSEWLTYQSLFSSIVPGKPALNTAAIITVAALALAGALAAAAFVKMFGISFLGKPRSDHAEKAREVPRVMNAGIGILMALCLAVGIFPAAVVRLIGRVTESLSGLSIADSMQGGPLFVFFPVEILGSAYSPAVIFAALAAIVLGSLLVIRLVGGKYLERKYGTWDCGFEQLNARMQFSSTGFSKALKIVFRVLFRPTRRLKSEGMHIYHPESLEYTVDSESVFEKYFYVPVLKFVHDFSRRVKFTVQTGSAHRYLLYIFLTVLVFMLYNRLV